MQFHDKHNYEFILYRIKGLDFPSKIPLPIFTLKDFGSPARFSTGEVLLGTILASFVGEPAYVALSSYIDDEEDEVFDSNFFELSKKAIKQPLR